MFAGLASCAIAAVRRDAHVRIFVWLGIWAAMYGAMRLDQSPAVIAASPEPARAAVPYVADALAYFVIVPALLAFAELTLGRLRTVLKIAAVAGGLIGVAGFVVFVAFGAPNALMPYNNLIAGVMLVILGAVLATPAASSKYFTFHNRRVLASRRVLVAGTAIFALEAFYSQVARPLGLPRSPTLDHLGFAALLFSLAYTALQLVFANERRLLAVDSELAIARKIQMGTLPAAIPSTPHLTIAATYRPRTAVAGDFYDFITTDPHCVGVLVADAAGHGIPAALIASSIKIAVQAVKSCATEPAALLAGLNRLLSAQSSSPLISAAYLWLDPENGRARYSAAGHPPILRLRRGHVERIDSNGFLFGMVQESVYPVATIPIAAGDRFLLYTDGLTEIENDGGEFFGESRLEQVVRNNCSRRPEELGRELLAEADRWRPRSEPQQDDITLIVIDVE